MALLEALLYAVLLGLVAALVAYLVLWLVSQVVGINEGTRRSIAGVVGVIAFLLTLLPRL